MNQTAYEIALGAACEARPDMGNGDLVAVVKAAIDAYHRTAGIGCFDPSGDGYSRCRACRFAVFGDIRTFEVKLKP